MHQVQHVGGITKGDARRPSWRPSLPLERRQPEHNESGRKTVRHHPCCSLEVERAGEAGRDTKPDEASDTDGYGIRRTWDPVARAHYERYEHSCNEQSQQARPEEGNGDI